MDENRVNQARQAVEENRERLNKVELDQEIIIAEYDKYRWLKIIVGAVFVLLVLSGLILLLQLV
ncbi:MAG: hypothetical protein ACKO65_00680 [Betaproteobacteria bacterium]